MQRAILAQHAMASWALLHLLHTKWIQTDHAAQAFNGHQRGLEAVLCFFWLLLCSTLQKNDHVGTERDHTYKSCNPGMAGTHAFKHVGFRGESTVNIQRSYLHLPVKDQIGNVPPRDVLPSSQVCQNQKAVEREQTGHLGSRHQIPSSDS